MQGGVAVSRARRWVLDRRRKLVRERALWRSGVRFVAGVDEVGMGPLAGPVVAAAVIFPPKVKIDGVRDSKLVSAKRRAGLADRIRSTAVGVGIGVIEVGEIDECNIYQAGLRAMRAAVDALPLPPEHLLIDARRLPDCPCEQTAIVDGDALVYSIAAASIIAKEHRDALMRELDERFPGYGFAQHVGYATRAHLDALRRLGPCAAHRHSFAPVRAAVRH